MKNIFFFIVLSSVLMLTACTGNRQTTSSKSLSEIQFAAYGNCGMCKDRIENALTISGVKDAHWHQEKQRVHVIYNSAKVSEAQLHQAVAEVGHDTDQVKATDKAYKSLHSCCNYRENPSCEPK